MDLQAKSVRSGIDVDPGIRVRDEHDDHLLTLLRGDWKDADMGGGGAAQIEFRNPPAIDGASTNLLERLFLLRIGS